MMLKVTVEQVTLQVPVDACGIDFVGSRDYEKYQGPLVGGKDGEIQRRVWLVTWQG